MEFVTGVRKKETLELSKVLAPQSLDQEVLTDGSIYSIRNMGEIAFVILRKRDGLLQTVWEEGKTNLSISELKEGDCIRVKGTVRAEERAPHGKEIRAEEITILSSPAESLPLAIDKWKLNTSLEAKLNIRSVSLRNVRERARFRIQEGIVRGFREFLHENGFTEIHTPKIGAKGAEGGANVFKLSYFHKPAVLAQSPQFYKQMMVGVFDRVFETGPVFRAEKYTMELLKKDYAPELEILNVTLPKTDKIPFVKFSEAKELVAEKYNRKIRNPFDLEPEEEELIGRYFKEEYDADFVFVTHYPSKKRPFYAMDDPADSRYTLSFDLLFRGLEITTGGQRIHDYHMLEDKIAARGMTDEGMEQYMDAFKYGMPPHGGLGIGMERLTMQLLGEENVREACLFPRDLNRLEP